MGGRICAQCNEPIPADRNMRAKFCTERCSRTAHRDSSTKVCNEPQCGKPMRAKGMCTMHWRRVARAEGREVNREWDEKRKANYHKRRAARRTTSVETIEPLDVYQRDVWMCGLCDTAVDNELAYPHPMSASLDHVQPLSKGGSHTWENLQLAHLTCNVSKGNRVAA